MAATEAMIGYGSKLKVETSAGSAVYTYLAEIKSVSPPSSTVDDVEATHMESPNRKKEFIAGLGDYGEISFDMNWIPGSTTDDFIIAWEASGERRSTVIEYPNGIEDTFLSYVRGYSGEAPLGDVMTATLTVKVAGDNVRA